jgi:7-keto-8-aminopelargonate synthetase-like enzyme
MKNFHSFVSSVYQIAQNAAKLKIAHLNTQDTSFHNNVIKINNNSAVNFGSCSYLGLEFDERLKAGAVEALNNFGTQFSSSRAYVSLGLYEELEHLFSKIFQGAHTLMVPTTTLGHLSAIPVLVHDEDCVILDHQVHSSVQNAANMLKARGIHVDMIRHNNMEMLEYKILELRGKYRKIWYMADGIYSMYGDKAPIHHIHDLMNRYDQLHFYVDDAHGMSCFGEHGAGYVMQQAPMHPKQVLAVSLAKAFATGGAVLVFPSAEQYNLVRSCGGPMITSGPIQPATLGAAIASAKIHLSPEIESLQEDLQENIKFTNLMLRKHNMPVLSSSESPVFFVGAGLPVVGNKVVKKLVDDGFYLNLGIYPAVPLKNTGIRFTITRLHTFRQIEEMTDRLAHHFHETLSEEKIEVSKVYKAFKLNTAEDNKILTEVEHILNKSTLSVDTHKTIDEVSPELWNKLFEGRGSFDWNGMKLLENSFTGNAHEPNNWKFDYLVVKDEANHPVLATFCTTSRMKDDMLSPASVSAMVEEMRKSEGEEFLTSKSVMMGSTLTEGEHLFLNRNHQMAKTALKILFDWASHLQEEYEANSIMFRDFHGNDEELDSLFMNNGFVKTDLSVSYQINNFDWAGTEEWLDGLSPKSRRHVRGTILKKSDAFEVEIVKNPGIAEVERWYELYLQVKEHSRTLNTYTMPFKLFQNIAGSPGWEIIQLRLKAEFDPEQKVVAVIFNYLSGKSYSAMFIGVDYQAQKDFMPYRQALYQTILRAKSLGVEKLHLGFTADMEKKRLGAGAVRAHGYVQVKDHFNLSVLGNLNQATVVVHQK